MSQLRKSASFRSRIPVRRNRITKSQRRCCCNPQIVYGDSPDTTNKRNSCNCGASHYKLRATRSSGVVRSTNSHRSSSHNHHHHNHHHNFHSQRHTSRHTSNRRYSSSSFSSSDESCESEAPHQKLAKQSRKLPLENCMYISTDAISLDGLLDSVSCGSFSSPPSPVFYQNTQEAICYRSSSYESLDKFNINLENLQINENSPFLPYPLTSNTSSRPSAEISLVNKHTNKNNQQYCRYVNTSNNKNCVATNTTTITITSTTTTTIPIVPTTTTCSTPSNNNTNNQINKLKRAYHHRAQEGLISINNKFKQTISQQNMSSSDARQHQTTKVSAISANAIAAANPATTTTMTPTTATTMATTTTTATTTRKGLNRSAETFNDEASKKLYYMEKQKQLSDWYYIKTKKPVDDDEPAAVVAADEVKQNTVEGIEKRNGKINLNTKNGKESNDMEYGFDSEENIETDDSLYDEHNYVNCGRSGGHIMPAIKTGPAAPFASLNRRAALGSARYASPASFLTTTSEVHSNTLSQRYHHHHHHQQQQQQSQQPVRWNNFDRNHHHHNQQQQQQQQPRDQQSQPTIIRDDTNRMRKYSPMDNIEAEYNEAVDAINCNDLKSNASNTTHGKPICPPYYCPPTYDANHQNISHELPQLSAPPVATTSAETADLSNVNVKLLKQHYQLQQQQQQQQQQQTLQQYQQRAAKSSSEYANMSFRRRVEAGRRNKNKVELQLEHWENLGNNKNTINSNNNSSTDLSVTSKCRTTRIDAGGEQANGGVTINNFPDGQNYSTTQNQQQPEQQQQQHNHNNVHSSNASSNASVCDITSNDKNRGNDCGASNNSISSDSRFLDSFNSDNINKPNNSRSQEPYQQQQYLHQSHNTLLNDVPTVLNEQFQQQQQLIPAIIHSDDFNEQATQSTMESQHQQQQRQQQNHHHHYQQQQQQRQLRKQCQFYPNPNEFKEEDSDQETDPIKPSAAPRRLPHPPTATPRATLRSRQIQKRSDETSCSSFEQLNIVGIPTSDDAEDEDDRHYPPVKGNAVMATTVAASTSSAAMAARAQAVTISDDCITRRQNYGNAIMSHEDKMNEQENRINLQTNLKDPDLQIHSSETHESHSSDYNSQNAMEQIALMKITDSGTTGANIATAITPTAVTASTSRPLPEIPKQLHSQQIQLQLQQNPQTRQLFGVLEAEMFPSKPVSSCRSDCELSGSYASLECPSPPGPPVSLPESRRDPQARLSAYLRTLYTDLALKEPIIPQWAIPVAPGALSAARLEPELRLCASSHGLSDLLTVDQILVSLQTKEGIFLEGPRRCLIECPAWVSRSNLCLRILHAWAKEPPWPTKGTPVALALFIPLAELKRGFAYYVEKELLAKGPLNPFSNGFGGFSAAWNSLEALGPKLLILLDGYESHRLGNPALCGGTPKKTKSPASLVGAGNKHHYPSDVHDLLEGRLFPEARVIITTSSSSCPELLSIVQRHIKYEGLTWGRSASLLGGGQWGAPSRLLDIIQESVPLRKIVRTPLGCLAITAIFESVGGDLPTDELDIIESVLNCVAPDASAMHASELGRLALFCLKMKRSCFSLAEMRMYCSTPESPLVGCLERNLLLGKSAKKKSEYVYHPICYGMMEFLASNYMASLAHRPGLLAAEITGMAVGDELDPDLLKVLKFAMTLLGDRAHILLSRLTPLWLTPQIVFTLALAGGHSEDNLAALCDIMGISKHPPISPLETKPLWVQVRSLPTDLMGWGMALKSPTCTLKNLEMIYQLEKHNLLEARKAIEIFLDSLIANESVSTLRLSSLIEMDIKDAEINYLANCVSKILLKPRLENFELVLTLLEEDPPVLKLQSVVAALCRTIPRQPRLSFLLLDLNLSTSQLVQLCSTLEKCPNVTRLSLPHLRCERGAITALASLLNSRPISFLSLPSCWGARDDPPSSSGVSMGSGSGSSTGTSGLIKQGSLPGVPSPRSYAPGIFSSLPRGVFVPQSSLGRSATLPRQPLEQTLDKRSCDSVVSKTWYPTPACDGGPHNSGTLHDLLLAARDSFSKLHGLDLSKAQLSLEDSMCLGETVRLSNTLHTLKLEGASRLSEVLPSVLGASESSCLQMLSIGSPRLSLEDPAIAMCARALTSCSTLRLLSLDGWSLRIENASTLSILRAFLSLTSIRELSLANCRLQVGLVKSDTKIAHAFESRSVVVLKLAGAQVTLADSTLLRGPQLLQYIGGFPCLRELDLSAPARSGFGSTHTTPLILDDKCIINFFQNLHLHFGLLNTLKICHWVIHFDDLSKTLKAISKCMRNSPISHLKIDGISVLDRPKKQRSEVNFIHCCIASLPQIRWLGISLAGKKEEQIIGIGNAVLDLKGYEIDIKLSESTIEHAKLIAQAISLDGKFDIKVSTFGTSSGILIHAEKSGTKSLTRKTKD